MLMGLSKISAYLSRADGREYLLRRFVRVFGIRRFQYRLVAQPVPRHQFSSKQNRKIVVERIGPSQYQIGWFCRPQHIVDSRFQQGALCWAAFKDERAIGCIWLVPGPYYEDEVRCRFVPEPAGEVAWDFDVYVVDDMRLTRTFALLRDAANAWMLEHGFRWTVSRIDSLKDGSLRSHAAMGAKILGTVTFWSIGQHQLSFGIGGLNYSSSPLKIPDICIPLPQVTQCRVVSDNRTTHD